MLFKKIKNKFKFIKEEFINDIKYYSFKLAFVKLINNLTYRGKALHKINQWSLNKRHRLIMDYLYKEYKHIFNKYKNEVNTKVYKENYPIWVCWLQGEENAPIVVKNCIDSIRRHSGNHEVILLTEKNINQYIDIPKYIIDKFKKKIIIPAHFADIIRMMLIKEYGGLWLDATVFCKNDIPENIFDMPFFSCKSPRVESNYISQYQWTAFILGGYKNSVFFKFMVEFYLEYWKKEDVAIDYLFMDYVIVLARKYIKTIDNDIENVPVNNLERDYIVQIFNDAFEKEKYNNILKSKTYFFKLSWRQNFKEYTEDGRETVFRKFISSYEKYFSF